jgi:hypothetical protein
MTINSATQGRLPLNPRALSAINDSSVVVPKMAGHCSWPDSSIGRLPLTFAPIRANLMRTLRHAFRKAVLEGYRRGAAMETTQRDDERELAQAILTGTHRRPSQSFGSYFGPEGGSCALGAAYEGVYLLPHDAHDAVPRRLDRFFHCLENVSRRCPAGCKKQIPIGAMIVHLNDDHRWTREQIADWLEHPPTVVQRNRAQQAG